MGNLLDKQSSNEVTPEDGSPPCAPKKKDVTIRVIPDSLSSASSSAPATTSKIHISRFQDGVSGLLSISFIPRERCRSIRSLSLNSIKSWSHGKRHRRRKSDPSPDMSHVSPPLTPVTNQAFIDALSDALNLTEDEEPPSLVTVDEETEHLDFADRDLVREYFESVNAGEVSEQDTEQRGYCMFQRLWQKNPQVPLKNPSLVVHWACGAGPWEIRVARQFPGCRVVGMDFKPPMLFCSDDVDADRVEFRQIMIGNRGDHDGLSEFQDNTVDLVVMGRVWFLRADTSQWDKVLAQILRILKPGGWIEIYDQDQPVLPVSSNPNDSRYLAKIERWHANARTAMVGFWVDRKQIYHMLIDAGFTGLNEYCVDLPVGEWASTEDLKETGYLVKDLRLRHVKQVGRWIREINRVSMEEFQETLNGTTGDLEQCHAHTSWIYIIAQKPKS